VRRRSSARVHELIARRKAQLERQLANLLSDPDSTHDSIEVVMAFHEQVSDYLKGVRRRQSLRWLVSLGIASLAVAAVCSLIHLRDPSFVLTGSTRALIYGVGPSDEEIAATTPLSRLSYGGSSGAYDFCSASQPSRGCVVADTLTLQSFTAFAGGEVRLRRRQPCDEVTFLAGGGLLQVRVHAAQPSPASAAPADEFRPIRVKEFETVQYCAAESQPLVLREPRFVVIGDATAEPPAERVFLPAALSGSIVLADTGGTRPFRSTDVVELGGLTHGVASIHRGEALDLSLSAKARHIKLLRSTASEDANPTWLDFVLGSPSLKAAASLIIGILAGLNVLRGKVEELIG